MDAHTRTAAFGCLAVMLAGGCASAAATPAAAMPMHAVLMTPMSAEPVAPTADPAAAATSDRDALISLLTVAPEAYYGITRRSKFYGDDHMDRKSVDGALGDRQYLLGSLGGLRDRWVEMGLVVDAGLTQTFQGVATGDGDRSEYLGSADVWVALDTGRAGMWSGGLFHAHAEADWGDPVRGTGGLLPLNGDGIMPGEPSDFALSELYLFQALPDEFAIALGKINWTAYADKSFFANDERGQFLHEGLVNDAVLGAFVPYTALGGGVFKTFDKEWSAGVVVVSSDSNATTSGFDELASDAVTYGFALSWTPTFDSLPGSYDVLVGYGTKSSLNFDIDQRYEFSELAGTAPASERGNNKAIALGGSQYVSVDDGVHRSDGRPVGWGPFFRAGFAPKDRNVIDEFLSVGVGGFGGPCGRAEDNWGIGWAGTHLSGDLRRDLDRLGIDVDDFEHVFEGFYGVAVTPAAHVSLHVQHIGSAARDVDNALVLALRVQLDF